MRIFLLGTGTPKPLSNRVCSSYLIEVGSDVLIMDHGPGAGQHLIKLARGVDVLIHMTYFMSGTEPHPSFPKCTGGHLDVARVAQEADAGTLVLSHMLEQIDQPGVRERVIKEILDFYSGEVI